MNKQDLFNELHIIINKFVESQDKKLEKYKETHDYILNIPFVQEVINENKLLKQLIQNIHIKKEVKKENIIIEILESSNVEKNTSEFISKCEIIEIFKDIINDTVNNKTMVRKEDILEEEEEEVEEDPEERKRRERERMEHEAEEEAKRREKAAADRAKLDKMAWEAEEEADEEADKVFRLDPYSDLTPNQLFCNVVRRNILEAYPRLSPKNVNALLSTLWSKTLNLDERRNFTHILAEAKTREMDRLGREKRSKAKKAEEAAAWKETAAAFEEDEDDEEEDDDDSDDDSDYGDSD